MTGTNTNTDNPHEVDEAHTPIRCETACSQYPNCQHDWSSWTSGSLPSLGDIIARNHAKVKAFGFLGDQDEPVIVEDLRSQPTIVRYEIRHAHTPDGRCVKSRWGLCPAPTPQEPTSNADEPQALHGNAAVVARIREASNMLDEDGFEGAVANWLDEAADHLDDMTGIPEEAVCLTAREGLECSLLGQALKVADTILARTNQG